MAGSLSAAPSTWPAPSRSLSSSAQLGKFSLRAFLCAAGLLLFPYFALVGTHLYTDPLAVLCTVAGVALYLRGRPWASAVCFIVGIACRQYIVAFPLALLARGLLLQARIKQIALRSDAIAPAIATLSLAGWYVFFGGFAPQTALHAQNLRGPFLSGARPLFPHLHRALFRRRGMHLVSIRCPLTRAGSGSNRDRRGDLHLFSVFSAHRKRQSAGADDGLFGYCRALGHAERRRGSFCFGRWP